MATRRQKRDNADGVALGEWIFFGVLLIFPIACFGAYAIVSRICAGFMHFGVGRRSCSFNETVSWLGDAGGWWKLLIVLGVVGLFTFLGREDDEPRNDSQAKPGEEQDEKS
jgi:hypothetical protein